MINHRQIVECGFTKSEFGNYYTHPGLSLQFTFSEGGHRMYLEVNREYHVASLPASKDRLMAIVSALTTKK